MKHMIVVGGGIAGLSAAFYVKKISGENLSVTLLEGSGEWGGKITTERVVEPFTGEPFVIEGGPDTFVVTKPWAVKLCKELGIADRLRGTNPDLRKTYILKDGALHELPGGLTMMIPTDVGSMLRTGLLSWSAKIRMGMDFFIPPSKDNGDESLGAFVTRRLGREAYENLVEPLMSGIYAGDGDRLSLEATLPYLRDLEVEYGGLVQGALHMRRKRAERGRKAAPGSRSVFLTPITGLAEIVESLLYALEDSNVEMRLNAPVRKVDRWGEAYRIYLDAGEVLTADYLVLAIPAFVSGDLIADFASGLAGELQAIEYVSTATVTLAYREADLPAPLDGYGYVIPRRENRKALACTWTSSKFPHRAPEGYALLRVFVGRAGQEGEIDWDESSLLDIATEELRNTLGIVGSPLLSRVYRWENAMPQYNLGHPARLSRIEAALDRYPGLALAGNGYRGIGIPDCIHSGQLAVEKSLEELPISSDEREVNIQI